MDETKRAEREERWWKHQAAMEAQVLRDFPPDVLAPWQAKVAAADLRWQWVAGMWPLTTSPDGEMHFTLRVSSSSDAIGVGVSLSGISHDVLIETARAIEVGWPL